MKYVARTVASGSLWQTGAESDIGMLWPVLVRVGAHRPDLDHYSERNVVAVVVLVRPHGMDGRGRNRYRNAQVGSEKK